MKKRFNKIVEAIDKGDAPQFFHPHKEREVEKGTEKLNPILPEQLPEETRKYLEYVTSASYKTVLDKVRRYTGRNPAEMNLPQVLSGVLQALDRIETFENENKERLKKLALDEVLSLPEFEVIKYHIKSGALKIVLKLGAENVDLENAVTEMELENMPDEEAVEDLTPIEIENQEIAQDFNEEKMRRHLAGILMQGNAVNKFYLFNLFKQKLDEINPRLYDLYGIACSHIHLLYYAQPDIDMNRIKQQSKAGAGQGSCNIEPQGDGYEITAAGANLPFLIHELVKCIYNYLALDVANNENLSTENLEQEVLEFISGPQVFNMFTKYIPTDRQNLIPFIYQEFLKLPISEIKAVLRGREEAIPIMDRVVRRSKQDYDRYIQQIRDWENENAGYGQDYNPE